MDKALRAASPYLQASTFAQASLFKHHSNSKVLSSIWRPANKQLAASWWESPVPDCASISRSASVVLWYNESGNSRSFFVKNTADPDQNSESCCTSFGQRRKKMTRFKSKER